MEILEFKKDVICILGLQGRLDGSSSPAVREQVFSIIERGESRLLFDCSKLDYISSAGIRVFYQIAHRMDDVAGKIAFCSLNGNVKKLFDMVALSSEFPVYETQGEAFQSF